MVIKVSAMRMLKTRLFIGPPIKLNRIFRLAMVSPSFKYLALAFTRGTRSPSDLSYPVPREFASLEIRQVKRIPAMTGLGVLAACAASPPGSLIPSDNAWISARRDHEG